MTTHSFHCPTCHAPLVPRGSIPVISCPYCQTSVVVPEELRQVAGETPWTTLLFDNFTSNVNNWLVGSQTSEYFAPLNQTIAEGRYRWQGTVIRASSITTAWLMGYYVADFHLSLNCKHIHGSKAGSSWGMVFRVQDNHNYYWFRITDAQSFAVSITKDSQWQQIVDWTLTGIIKPYGVNQLEVITRDTHFTFLINGQIVAEVDDTRFPQGLVGLAIEGYTSGEALTFDFMDLTLRARR